MFRIRVRIDPERLRGRAEIVRSGLPGIAYVLTDPDANWPPSLQASATDDRPVTAIAQAQGAPLRDWTMSRSATSARSRSTT